MTPTVKHNASVTDIIFLSVLIGLITTLWGYHFGRDNHVDILPVVMRAIDPLYLPHDFYTNATAEFGLRYNFAHLVAFLAQIIPLPPLFFTLTLLINFSTALVTGMVARDLFNRSNLAGLLAPAIVMSVNTFGLSGGGSFGAKYLIPSDLSLPFVLISLWAGIRQRFLLCAIMAGLASLVHPLGLETGLVLLAAMTIESLVRPASQMGLNKPKDWTRLGAAYLVFGFFAALTLVPYLSAERIDSVQFMQIFAYFRLPHHALPSTFSLGSYIKGFFFLIAAGIAWYWWQKAHGPSRSAARMVLFITMTVLLICLGGYVFVEIIPFRLWASALTFNLLLIVKWLGLILISGWIAQQLAGVPASESRFGIFVTLVAVLSPLTISMVFVARLMKGWVKQYIPMFAHFLGFGVLFIVVGVTLFLLKVNLHQILLYILYVSIVLGLVFVKPKWLAQVGGLVMTGLVVGLLLGGQNVLPVQARKIIPRPIFSFANHSGPEANLAKFIRNNTPKEAIILTPPFAGEFRLLAKRAIVVDFKSFPHQDLAMLEWQRRLFEIYGEPEAMGFDAAWEMDRNYRTIDDARLLSLQAKYKFTYAILYRKTPTALPIIFENDHYKVVALREM